MITELWATPILQVHLDNQEEITKELLRVQAVPNKTYDTEFEDVCKYFHPSTVLTEFRKTILELGNFLVSNYEGGEVFFSRAWFNHQRFGESKYPHVHHRTKVAVVFYMNAPTHCGDILLFDPRNGVDGWDVGNQIYHRITPQAGMLLMFPAYLVHVTEENRNREPRISFVANLGGK